MKLRLRALFLSAVLVLTGCTTASLPSPDEQIQSGVDFYDQEISWSACDVGFECATVAAPLNWLNPSRVVLSIALVRKAETEGLTPMLVNPGGPGSSGIDYLVDGYDTLGTNYLRSNFQLIGFDPRGVGKTSPVTCDQDTAKDRLLYEHVPHPFGSSEYLDYARLVGSEFAESCQSQEFSSAYFNTQQTARDMDLIRVVLGLETLNYLGFSYGTQLGASYAALFPERVGLMVLDGAVDPTVDPSTKLVGQIKGFDKALEAYLVDCVRQSFCPFQGDVETAKTQIANFLLARESTALPTFDERGLALQAAIAGIIVTLYSEESWQFLSQAFDEAFDGNGSTFLLLADFYNDRDPEGGYLSNITEANYAISCSDDWLWKEVPDVTAEILEASPVFGRYFASDDFGCEGWPQGIGMRQLDYSVALANGPLIIGTTGDPATPYSQAVALSQLLDGATLLTLEGEGHTAYGSNTCINEQVDRFLSGEDLGPNPKTCS